MKTKFDSLVKVKKNEVSKIERNIQKINHGISKISQKIEDLEKAFLNFSFPNKGTFSQIQQAKITQNALKMEIENYKNQLLMLENRKKELLEELKKAKIEYEKVKYLQNEEIKKFLKEELRKESMKMDELGILLRKKDE